MTPLQMAKLHAAAFTTQRPWSETEFATLIESPHVFIITDPTVLPLVGQSQTKSSC